MTCARKEQICLDETPYYHCICRCVRRAFLCGEDKVTGQNFDHRKQWLVDKIHLLSSIFAIDICAYAIMSNHYHLVLKVDKDKAEHFSDIEVVMRWKKLFNGHILVDRWLSTPGITQAEKDKALEIIQIWRARLYDLGWYMRCLNEHIAVQANKEDNCKGRFWEGRFKSQALLDETALLACMAYVDLNPIRAAISETPETSDFTSVQNRIITLANAKNSQQAQPSKLLPFIGYQSHCKKQKGLPFMLIDYFELVEWTGRCIREDKRGAVPAHIKPLFERFHVNEQDWLKTIKEFNRHFIHAAGSYENMTKWAISTHRKWCATHQALKLYQ
ncbi:transposase [Thalassotalea sp. 1_MG-2023]|uniref:transposase n=1 Tax=Thalassotalea sp. 1_MG-2023 TaxID=3062680 RepID=UPI0026E3064A|nr:transposase [Thalassotalea sp. 1_MG-2023]MDO6428809.1 transposase [Thalassotalea sp. 1_MG-2023]